MPADTSTDRLPAERLPWACRTPTIRPVALGDRTGGGMLTGHHWARSTTLVMPLVERRISPVTGSFWPAAAFSYSSLHRHETAIP